MAEDLILLDRSEENKHVAVLTLNRPDAGNALNTPMLRQFANALDLVDRDSDIRVLIMRSNGNASSFGADVNELVIENEDGYSHISKSDAETHVNDGRIVAGKLFNLRVPVIGIIHGYCLGGGAEFYTLCDVLYGASGGKEEGGMMYGFPEPSIGVMAGWMGPETLIKKIGAGNARDILFSCRFIDGNEALSMGVVQALYPKEELFERAMKWAGKVASNAPFAIESTRKVINNVLFPDHDSVLNMTGSECAGNILTTDFLNGAKKVLTRSKEQPDYERK
ncbi:MAG TPA: enoyl-CoA hydratase/isomerase family protein [bacterium]|jgi:enoyl-CoA hydratase